MELETIPGSDNPQPLTSWDERISDLQSTGSTYWPLSPLRIFLGTVGESCVLGRLQRNDTVIATVQLRLRDPGGKICNFFWNEKVFRQCDFWCLLLGQFQQQTVSFRREIWCVFAWARVAFGQRGFASLHFMWSHFMLRHIAKYLSSSSFSGANRFAW